MQDGYTQTGAGQSDNRVAGQDLQHNRQTRTADEAPSPHRVKTQYDAPGSQISKALSQEMDRHTKSKVERLKHLEDHYRR
jgi:hypothetical protein